MSSTDSTRSYRIKVLERAYRIINEVADRPRTVPELVEKLNLDSATVYRIVRNLSNEGFLRQFDDTYRYGLGFRFLKLGHQLLEQLDLRETARPHLEALTERTGESAFLGVRDGDEVVFVDRVDGVQGIRLSLRIGDRRPLNAGAVGKVLLAFAPPPVTEAVLDRGAARITERTLVEPEKLQAEIERIRDLGYAESRGENTPGAGSFAAPVWDARGIVVAALALGGPEERLLEESGKRNLEAVLDAATVVSRALGASLDHLR